MRIESAFLFAGVALVVFCLWLLLAGGCALHSPPPVEPNYPPEPPFIEAIADGGCG